MQTVSTYPTYIHTWRYIPPFLEGLGTNKVSLTRPQPFTPFSLSLHSVVLLKSWKVFPRFRKSHYFSPGWKARAEWSLQGGLVNIVRCTQQSVNTLYHVPTPRRVKGWPPPISRHFFFPHLPVTLHSLQRLEIVLSDFFSFFSSFLPNTIFIICKILRFSLFLIVKVNLVCFIFIYSFTANFLVYFLI